MDGGSGILVFVFPSRILCASFNIAVVSSLFCSEVNIGSVESEEFEIIFNNLSLEEVIGLKLELASKSSFNGKLYGLFCDSGLKYSITIISKNAFYFSNF